MISTKKAPIDFNQTAKIKAFQNRILQGDALEILRKLPAESVDSVVTSPPYYTLRDYGVKGQIGLEETFTEYLEKLLLIFEEAKRVLKRTGTCWVVIGDTYGGTGTAVTLINRQKKSKGKSGNSLHLSHLKGKYSK